MEITGKKVLAVFAHPDDDELTCLGTLIKLQSTKAQVFLLELTQGENSRGMPARRVQETRRVAELAGYTLYVENLPDGQMVYNIELVKIVEGYINTINPHIIITHFPQTLGRGHQDHVAVASAVVNAARRSKSVECIMYAEPPTQNENFVPNFFVDITEYIQIKKAAIQIHESEQSKDYISADAIVCKARWWAFQAHPNYFNSGRYFEAFVIVKWIMD